MASETSAEGSQVSQLRFLPGSEQANSPLLHFLVSFLVSTVESSMSSSVSESRSQIVLGKSCYLVLWDSGDSPEYVTVVFSDGVGTLPS